MLWASTGAAIAASGGAGGQGQGDPRLDYVLQCQGCHLPDGSGVAASGVPRMLGFVGGFVGLEGGRAYLVQVPGVSQAPLDDAEIAALLNWMLVRFSADELPDPFVPYSATEVASYRATRLVDVGATRAALVALLPSGGAAGDSAADLEDGGDLDGHTEGQ